MSETHEAPPARKSEMSWEVSGDEMPQPLPPLLPLQDVHPVSETPDAPLAPLDSHNPQPRLLILWAKKNRAIKKKNGGKFPVTKKAAPKVDAKVAKAPRFYTGEDLPIPLPR